MEQSEHPHLVIIFGHPIWRYYLFMVYPNNYNSNIKSHCSQITSILLMKSSEILWKSPKCDTKQSQCCWKKPCQQLAQFRIASRPSICKKKKKQYLWSTVKMRLACILFSPRDICLLVLCLKCFLLKWPCRFFFKVFAQNITLPGGTFLGHLI